MGITIDILLISKINDDAMACNKIMWFELLK